MGIFRTVLALLVVITHTSTPVKFLHISGSEAVICFYVISGFLMSRILNNTYKTSYRAFYINRFLKIYPTYLASLAFSILCFLAIPTGHHNPIKLIAELITNHNNNVLAYTAVSNITILGSDISRLSCLDSQYIFHLLGECNQNSIGAHNLLFIPQAWTLAIEILFYLIAPFVCIKLSRCIGLLIAIQVIQDFLGDKYGILNNESFMPIQLKYFLIGALANLLSLKFGKNLSINKLVTPTILLAIFISANWNENNIFLAFLTAFLLMVMIDKRENKFSKFIGQFSYPIYLVHYPLAKYFEDHLENRFQFIVTAALSFLISYLVLILIVNPIEKIRSKVKNEI